MADPITDERLRYHATRSWTAFDAGTYDELQAIAAELLAHRNTINKAEGEAEHALDGEWFSDLCDAIRLLRTRRDEARAEVEWLRNRNGCLEGIIDDIQAETGHCRFLDDEGHEPPHLPDHVRAIVQERDEALSEVKLLNAVVELLRAALDAAKEVP